MTLRPLIAICGTTGVGKSKLAIDLALRINATSSSSTWRGAKVINADAMQVYEGLDIITNKVTQAEKRNVEHLMMGFKKPGEQYVVGQWVQDTLTLIDEMHRNREIPIVVGGTSYWIQHLIFPNRLVKKDIDDTAASPPVEREWSQSLLDSFSTLPPELHQLFQNLPEEPPSGKTDPDFAFQLHTLLSHLDPPVGQRWHWRDTRKVLRSLEIIKETKRRSSEIIEEQSQTHDDDALPRFKTLCFWLYAQSPALHLRLDSRVDDMLSQGLLDEVRQLQALTHEGQSDEGDDRSTSAIDFTNGIYQSIGYREFHGYLNDPNPAAYEEAVERMKISTRQYAKRQISWIRNKLIPAVTSANKKTTLVPFYLLDATELGNCWTTNVELPAMEITEAFLKGQTLPEPTSLSSTAATMLQVTPKDTTPTAVLQSRQKRICPVCTMQPDRPVMVEEGEHWDIHTKTRSHRRLAAKAQHHVHPSPQGQQDAQIS